MAKSNRPKYRLKVRKLNWHVNLWIARIYIGERPVWKYYAPSRLPHWKTVWTCCTSTTRVSVVSDG